jgi:hypothetical protein
VTSEKPKAEMYREGSLVDKLLALEREEDPMPIRGGQKLRIGTFGGPLQGAKS